MGKIRIPRRVKFFTSIIFQNDLSLNQAQGELAILIGKIQEKTANIPFNHTTYYDDEMGGNLTRIFLLFEPLLHRDTLPDIKLKTNDIEQLLSSHGKRTVNIDPGYLTFENVVLATTKGYSHRIYMGKGVYGDLTLIFNKGTYTPLDWTYPDYREQETIAILNQWREIYKKELQC